MIHNNDRENPDWLNCQGNSGVMGILNVTPDSFSDGGRHFQRDAAIARGLRLLDEGAHIIDIGGESTRPGYTEVDPREEADRVVPVVEGILASRPQAVISVDTTKVEVARRALAKGARIINDVNGLQGDSQLAQVVAEHNAVVVLMRNARLEEGVSGHPVASVRRSWDRSIEIADRNGVDLSRIVLDPGIGFGTTRNEDLTILRELSELRSCGFPLLLGVSRKRITALPLGLPLEQRLETSLAAVGAGVWAGVELFRVHDVAETVRYLSLLDLIVKGGDLCE